MPRPLSVKERLLRLHHFLQHASSYDFAQSVRLCAALADPQLAQALSDTPPSISEKFNPFGPVRFRATVRYHPATSAINRVELVRAGGTLQPVLWVNFAGIAGAQGPLAYVYTERVFRNLRDRDHALASFLDIFNHKIIALIHANSATLPGFDATPAGDTRIGKILLAMGGQREKPTSGTPYLLTYCSSFWKRVRTAENLKQILASFFQAKVRIREFCGAYAPIPPEQISRIGVRGCFHTLNRDLLLGNRVWQLDQKIQIVLEELPYTLYRTFNPHTKGTNLSHLVAICRHYLPATLVFEVLIAIRPPEKPAMRLGDTHNLGFDTWLPGKSAQPEPPRFVRTN